MIFNGFEGFLAPGSVPGCRSRRELQNGGIGTYGDPSCGFSCRLWSLFQPIRQNSTKTHKNLEKRVSPSLGKILKKSWKTLENLQKILKKSWKNLQKILKIFGRFYARSFENWRGAPIFKPPRKNLPKIIEKSQKPRPGGDGISPGLLQGFLGAFLGLGGARSFRSRTAPTLIRR